MRLKGWCLATCLFAIVGLLLSSQIQGTAAEPAADADASSQEEFRTWTDRSKTYHVEAVLVEFKDAAVTLKKKDGTTLKVPIEQLDDACRQYVEAFATGAGGGELPSPPGPEPNESSAGGGDTAASDDEGLRTAARGNDSTRSGARTSYRSLARTTARTTAKTTAGPSNNRGTRQVVVEGVGATAEEALKDCFRNAVSTVMGTIIDAETQVENDRLVLDRILTFTDGFVDSYEELDTAHVEDGLIHRRIAATVRRDSLLLACGKAESMSVDASGLYPEVMTRLERRRSARALLRRTLDLLPGGLLQARVTGRPPIDKLGEESTILAPTVAVSVDAKRYDAVEDRLIAILRCLAKQDGAVSAITPVLPHGWQGEAKRVLRQQFLGVGAGGTETMPIVDADFGPVQALMIRKTPGSPNRAARDAAGETLIIIRRQTDWKWFLLDNPVELPFRTATIAVSLRDGDGGEVKAATLTLGPWVPGIATPPGSEARGAVRTVFISPSFLYYVGEGYRIPKILVARSMTVHGRIALENEQLSHVKTIDAGISRSH